MPVPVNELAPLPMQAMALEYKRIMEYASGSGNDEALACIISSWQFGKAVMPDSLGLEAGEFKDMLSLHFPGLDVTGLSQPGRLADAERSDEYQDVLKLLLDARAGQYAGETAMAMIVAQACHGQDHLWQDMGLWSRDQLSALMMRNFPALAGRNTQNMKWKKFIYKQLCDAEGIYTCRAPSCEVCADYGNCFA